MLLTNSLLLSVPCFVSNTRVQLILTHYWGKRLTVTLPETHELGSPSDWVVRLGISGPVWASEIVPDDLSLGPWFPHTQVLIRSTLKFQGYWQQISRVWCSERSLPSSNLVWRLQSSQIPKIGLPAQGAAALHWAFLSLCYNLLQAVGWDNHKTHLWSFPSLGDHSCLMSNVLKPIAL